MACYSGETTNLYKRIRTHYDGLDNNKTNNVLAQHSRDFHAGLNLSAKDFTLTVSRGQGNKLDRQAEEGVMILEDIKLRDRLESGLMREEEREDVRKVIIMNSRREFLQPLGGIKVKTSYL